MLEKVWGDYFEILYTGTFKSRTDLTWKVVQANTTNKRIIVIPMDYGEEKIKEVAKNLYNLPYSKSVVQNVYFVYTDNFDDAAIISVLENF